MIDDFTPKRPKAGTENNDNRHRPNIIRPSGAADTADNSQPDIQKIGGGAINANNNHEKNFAPKKHLIRGLGLPKIIKWSNLSKKQRLASLMLSGLLLIGGTVAALELLTPAPPVPAAVMITPKKEPPPPETLASPLTGIQVPPALAQLPVTGVMIENSPDARPQSGLSSAGVVFEAIAEGGITRFLALYQEDQPDYIGPVRSVRPYYLDFLVPFDAPIAHAGGSGQALAEIREQGIKDLDHGPNASAYQRVSSRFAPHNLYTSRAKLLELHNQKGYTSSSFEGWVRKNEETPLEVPAISKINIAISGRLYDSSFEYDKTTNSYKRFMAGRPHTDERSKEQISPKVLIVIETSYGKNGIYSVYGTTGSGKVSVFQDGARIDGTWEKSGRKNNYIFKTPDSKILKLNPGRTWVTMVKAGDLTASP